MDPTELPPEFWEAFNLSKDPREHMHTLPGGGRVYCTREHVEVWCTFCEQPSIGVDPNGQPLCATHFAWSALRDTHDDELNSFVGVH